MSSLYDSIAYAPPNDDQIERGRALDARERHINQLLRVVLDLPASMLTAGDVLFIGEKPTTYRQFFYTPERLARLRELAKKA